MLLNSYLQDMQEKKCLSTKSYLFVIYLLGFCSFCDMTRISYDFTGFIRMRTKTILKQNEIIDI